MESDGNHRGNVAELGVLVAVPAIVVALITPLPPFMLDLLLVVDMMMSVIVMMVASVHH
ncbi:MAG: hypothetical protein U0Q18_14080 [Bryobacteraceae bacterium]